MLERQRDPVFRRSLGTVREKVKSGIALSDAFRQEGDLYPPIFAASLVAGERSGNLDEVLRRFASHLRLNQSLKKKAVSASVYPIVLLSMMAVLVAVLLVYVIPQFQSFYEGLGAELPLPTRHPAGGRHHRPGQPRLDPRWRSEYGAGRSCTGCGGRAPAVVLDRAAAAAALLRRADEDVRHQPAHADALDPARRAGCPC